MEIYSVCSFPPPHYFLPFLTLPPFWALLLPSPIQSGFACKVKMDPVSIFKKRWFHSNSKARSFPEKQKALQVFLFHFVRSVGPIFGLCGRPLPAGPQKDGLFKIWRSSSKRHSCLLRRNKNFFPCGKLFHFLSFYLHS